MTTGVGEHGRGLAAVRSLPRHDRWVIVVVVLALAALILGFAASAPAFRGTGSGATRSEAIGLEPRAEDVAGALEDTAGPAPGAATATTTTLDERSDK